MTWWLAKLGKQVSKKQEKEAARSARSNQNCSFLLAFFMPFLAASCFLVAAGRQEVECEAGSQEWLSIMWLAEHA